MTKRRSDDEFMRELSTLIQQEGIASLSIGEMAARLNCSRRRLYQVAATKQELLLVVAQRFFADCLRRGRLAAEQASEPSQEIVAYSLSGVETASEMSTAFLRDLQASEAGCALFDAFQKERAQGGQAILDAGIQKGYYNAHNTRLATEIGLAAAMRIRRAEFLAEIGMSFEEAMAEAYHLMHHGLLRK